MAAVEEERNELACDSKNTAIYSANRFKSLPNLRLILSCDARSCAWRFLSRTGEIRMESPLVVIFERPCAFGFMADAERMRRVRQS